MIDRFIYCIMLNEGLDAGAIVGEEIDRDNFDAEDYRQFADRLHNETRALGKLFQDAGFDNQNRRVGYEIELCLVDKHGLPAKFNHEVIETANNDLLTLELARFNLELNSPPFAVSEGVCEQMYATLNEVYAATQKAADKYDAEIGMFGVLPSLQPHDLEPEDNMSIQHRYKMLSQQIIGMRGRPVRVELNGVDNCVLERDDVMLEAMSTSLQVHLQIPYDELVDGYHAGLWATMLILGATANSSLVMGHRGWQESRVAIFKQAVDTRNEAECDAGESPRVMLGSGYVESLLELFEENLEFSPILPALFDDSENRFHHLCLHNGTIWRWVRPIVGGNESSGYHLRLELRVVPSGPSLVDTMANAIFYIGLTLGLMKSADQLTNLPFEELDHDFYRAAKHGGAAEVRWIDGNTDRLQSILLNHAIPLAEQALTENGYGDCSQWMGIIRDRVSSGLTGANWISQHWDTHQDSARLVRDYLERARRNTPVHLWDIPNA